MNFSLLTLSSKAGGRGQEAGGKLPDARGLALSVAMPQALRYAICLLPVTERECVSLA